MSGQHGSEQAGASVADLCARWVSIDREIEHLTGRWSTLEVLALRPVPRSGDSAEGVAEEMAIIDGRLAVLDAAKASCTDALATTSARSFGDVVAHRQRAGLLRSERLGASSYAGHVFGRSERAT